MEFGRFPRDLISRKLWLCPDMTEKIVAWDIKSRIKRTKYLLLITKFASSILSDSKNYGCHHFPTIENLKKQLIHSEKLLVSITYSFQEQLYNNQVVRNDFLTHLESK